MHWKVHTPSLLQEVLRNKGAGILAQPINIFGKILAKVAERAAELDDPELNILMMRLTLYDQADPEKHTFKDIQAAYAAQEKRIFRTPSIEPSCGRRGGHCECQQAGECTEEGRQNG